MQVIIDRNIQTVKDYFQFCVDGKETHRVKAFFSKDIVIHRSNCEQPIKDLDVFEQKLKEYVTDRYEQLQTSFQKIIAAGNEVVVALTHEAHNANTWKGYDVHEKNVTWTSIGYFKFDKKGMIIEEIVERNELHMAEQLGLHLSTGG